MFPNFCTFDVSELLLVNVHINKMKKRNGAITNVLAVYFTYGYNRKQIALEPPPVAVMLTLQRGKK